jgi:general secretion pathway protein K
MAFRFEGSKTEDGFVLVAVIWLAGLLAIMATGFMITVRSHTLSARNVVFNSKAEYLADGMVMLTALQLTDQSASSKKSFAGETYFCRWEGNAEVAVRIQDQAGLVDLNTASPQLITAMLSGLNASSSEARNLAAEFQDYRDADNQGADGGLELTTYDRKSFGPKNAPFAVVEEVDQLPHVTDEMTAQLIPLVTVHSQQTGFDPTRAPQPLIDLLGAKDRQDAELTNFSSSTPSKIFGIDVLVKSKQNSAFYRKAIVELILQPDRPFVILDWQRGRNADGWKFPTRTSSPCIN